MHNFDRIKQQIDFIYEIDKVKSIFRKTKLFDGSRYENDAEHSWTICIMAIMLKEYANFEINLEKVVTMLLLHDIVEIDVGDIFLYDPKRANIHQKEDQAAKRIFGLLPQDQAEYYYQIWLEFEERKSNEAKFATAFDRTEPILQNYKNEGLSWKANKITKEMVIAKNQHAKEGSEIYWQFILKILDECEQKGYFHAEN